MNYVVEMSKMSVNVTPGSKWFFISTSWIEKWKKYVHFDKLEGQSADSAILENERVHPGKINCEDIILTLTDETL